MCVHVRSSDGVALGRIFEEKKLTYMCTDSTYLAVTPTGDPEGVDQFNLINGNETNHTVSTNTSVYYLYDQQLMRIVRFNSMLFHIILLNKNHSQIPKFTEFSSDYDITKNTTNVNKICTHDRFLKVLDHTSKFSTYMCSSRTRMLVSKCTNHLPSMCITRFMM